MPETTEDVRKTTWGKSPHSPVDLIAAEVRSLRKGRGIQSGDLEQRLGPHLKELAAGGNGGHGASRRYSLMTEIGNCSKALADDLRTAIQASVSLGPQTRHMLHFKDRVSWLADQLGYEYRTALRRIDTAEVLLAEEIARELSRRRGRVVAAADGWQLAQLKTLFRLDSASPEAHEHRRIVATRSGLADVMAWTDVPKGTREAGSELAVEVMYGGRLVRTEHSSGDRFESAIQLPRSLAEGEEHEYGLLLRIPEGRPMRPHYIFSPEYPCGSFELTVRFDLRKLPVWVRLVDGETVRVFDAALPGDDLVTVDESGEIHLQFDNPIMYLCYGAQWYFSD
jgi:hypothetical protein